MIFNSYSFIIFFLIVLSCHYCPWFSWPAKKWLLLCFSYLFYAAWNPPFVILIWLSSVLDWYAAKRIARAHCIGSRHHARAWLALSMIGNLGVLGYFKYGGFLLDNITVLLGYLHVAYAPPRIDIILPVGISFYTFQTMSYTLDVYRRNTPPSKSIIDFLLYVTFFPQLVAGPIVRAVDFLPQCVSLCRATAAQFNWGISLFVLGLFEKVVLADLFLAPVADMVYESALAPDPVSAWIGTLAFACQIFCDFAGYSTCAIGVAMTLGFALPANFRFPYAAIGFSDFWSRWHISLSSWLRDYLYIPLGGNRKGTGRTYLNLMVTMLLGGLWHGASWTFVVWGGLHGLYLVVERLLHEHVLWLKRIPRLVTFPVGALLTFFLVNITWVFFRARSFSHAFDVFKALIGLAGDGAMLIPEGRLIAFGVIAVVVGTHWIMRNASLETIAARTPWPLRSVAVGVMLVLILLSKGENRAFIYFQF
jgi:alginate O-acetyltransferase complex protein AlgI